MLQECIPVGRVPSAAVVVCWWGCLPARGCLPRWGCLPGGCVYPNMHCGRHPPCEQNDRQVEKHYLSATSFAGGNKCTSVQNWTLPLPNKCLLF